VIVGVEADRDRYTYHFDNPSTFDTAAPVSHFFEQRYNADNIWLTAAARYAAGVRWETSGGITPERRSTADDYDTFFDPNGTTIVAGTTGPNAIRSFRISQRADFVKVGPVIVSAGYRLRIDHSDFGVGHKTIAVNGIVVSASDVTTPEMTSSQMHEIFAGAAWTTTLAPGWTLSLDGEAAPTTIARLVVQLPDKYPGQDLVFVATVAAANGRVMLQKRAANWIVELSAGAGTTWSYRSTASLSRNMAAARLSLGRTF
jgi:hypothetical protein